MAKSDCKKGRWGARGGATSDTEKIELGSAGDKAPVAIMRLKKKKTKRFIYCHRAN